MKHGMYPKPWLYNMKTKMNDKKTVLQGLVHDRTQKCIENILNDYPWIRRSTKGAALPVHCRARQTRHGQWQPPASPLSMNAGGSGGRGVYPWGDLPASMAAQSQEAAAQPPTMRTTSTRTEIEMRTKEGRPVPPTTATLVLGRSRENRAWPHHSSRPSHIVLRRRWRWLSTLARWRIEATIDKSRLGHWQRSVNVYEKSVQFIMEAERTFHFGGIQRIESGVHSTSTSCPHLDLHNWLLNSF